jgi:hypothetical protein
MSLWDDLTGGSAADASRAAAQDTYAKQQQAISDLIGAGGNYATSMSDLAKGYDPYIRTGGAGNDALYNLMQNPGSLRGLPGYQFDQEEGVNALDRSAAARGMLNSGRQSKDLLRFGTRLADKTYGDEIARLLGISQFGAGATGARAGLIGQGLGGELGARTTAYGGGMNAAGTIGQGDVAGAQAEQHGAQNLLGTAAYLGGSAMGSGMFGNRGSAYGAPAKPKYGVSFG